MLIVSIFPHDGPAFRSWFCVTTQHANRHGNVHGFTRLQGTYQAHELIEMLIATPDCRVVLR